MADVTFNLLEVDLTAGTSKVVDVTEDVKKYFGARGLANKLLWEMVPQGADALSPENILHIGIGPCTGLVGTKTVLSFKSPLTNWAGRATTSGYFGEEMVRAHYNVGILLRGKAPKPVYLYVFNDKVEIRDASDLWGKMKLETEVILRDRLKEETGEVFGVLDIGPAGENLVRFANVTTEFVHSASKWGVGAVMGSKNVKAVCVKGTQTPMYADHAAVWALWREYATSTATADRRLGESRWGHTTSMPNLLRNAAEGIKNSHSSYDPIVEKSNALVHNLKYMQWADGCPGCAAACFVPFFKNGPTGAYAGEFRHDNTGNFNANIMVGYEDMTEISSWIDELGVDGEESGGIVAWAIDLYEAGIITKADLGGLELKWGSIEATNALLKKIAYRDGKAADALADGYHRAFKVFGEESIWYAWQFHGCSGGTYDARNKSLGRGLEYGTSHNGARMGAGLGSALTESATLCQFATSPFAAISGSDEDTARIYTNAVAGWNLTKEEVHDIVLRNYYFNRAYSMREGYYPANDDGLPPRCFDEPIKDKYGNEYVWTKDEWDTKSKEYRVNTLKLTEDGLLPRAEVERLGLDFVVPVLDPLKCIG
jgi:aldehyde:ferredoxin oxidoreductase